jgi:hypothetical protein
MAIQITHVSVKNLGPILDFDKDLKPINLVYGGNEQGKTYLVEFLYRSLFKNQSINTRNNTAGGQISISGLGNRSISFSPSTKKKLEDLWEDKIPGLPKDFSKLLVVKGADLDFTSSTSAGIDDKILKEFLSGESLLDKIEKRLGRTEITSTISEGKITGAIRGNLSKYYDGRESIDKIDLLFKEIGQNISGGTRFQLGQEIETLDKQIQEQEIAKRYLAYSIDRQIKEIKGQLKETPEDTLSDLEKLIDKYHQNDERIKSKKLELATKFEKSKHYPWVNTALEEYQNLINQGASKKSITAMVWLIISLLAAIAAIILIITKMPYIAIAGIVLALIFGSLYLFGQRSKASLEMQNSEIKKIENEYKERFNTNRFSGLSTLKTTQSDLQQDYFSSEQLKKDLEGLNVEQTQLEADIFNLFTQVNLPVRNQNEWTLVIENMVKNNRNQASKVQQYEVELGKLDVPADLFIDQPASVEYDRTELENNKRNREDKKEELRKVEEELQRLKQEVCGMADEEINIPWEELIEKLQKEREDTVEIYRNTAASIMAQIKLNEVLADLRNIESERIEQGLASNEVQQAVKITTTHYSLIEKEEDELFVSDQYGRYKLKDLSTGAKEQVLLGLRIGFAARILAGEHLFLILDDAFQHSDWVRRKILVEQLYKLANEGWQIIYFTMDDHIRSLFEERSKQIPEEMYQTILLPN